VAEAKMHQIYVSGDDRDHLTADLNQFLRWFTRAAVPVGLLEAALSLLVPSPLLGMLGAMTLGVAGLAIWARTLVARAAVSRAVIILCSSFLGVALIATVLLPHNLQ
jgi:hypothetical protein